MTTIALDLNRRCTCQTLDRQHLYQQLSADPALHGLFDTLAHAHLFSSTAVFVSAHTITAINKLVMAVESTLALTTYQQSVLAHAPAIAQLDAGPTGVFMGYDFHLGATGPQLIEINTNAGGALLNAVLARAQKACCTEMAQAIQTNADLAHIEQRWFAMFQREWQLQRGDAPIGRIAIVDDDPAYQYLYPEFQLCQQLLARFGVAVIIADARDLIWESGTLQHEGQCIDMVYNRLTDFYLDDSAHAALRSAYLANAVVLTPHPRVYALYADKRNLVTLSDAAQLTALGVDEVTRAQLLAGVPHTQLVHADNAEALWAQRRKLFFKPATGYGSKAAYRGDKLTRRVWETILAGDYVAQKIAPPSERIVSAEDADSALKLDVRGYVYQGEVQLLAARLYAGQTTNFRTPGGGFAPVFVV
ncbi:MAG: hypothetical protein HOP20_08760 [Sulfuriferula sp.]|nr:hypothetical protein [Sulfuriferula sp.]